MSWDDLSYEVSSMFGEYTYRTNELELALEVVGADYRARRAEYRRDYRRNPLLAARERAAVARYRAANLERLRARARNYYHSKDKQKHIERAKRWKQANPEKTRASARERQRRWRDAFIARDPEGFKAWSRENARRTRERNLEKFRARDRQRKAAQRERNKMTRRAA